MNLTVEYLQTDPAESSPSRRELHGRPPASGPVCPEIWQYLVRNEYNTLLSFGGRPGTTGP
jgi:hypothetical protein